MKWPSLVFLKKILSISQEEKRANNDNNKETTKSKEKQEGSRTCRQINVKPDLNLIAEKIKSEKYA